MHIDIPDHNGDDEGDNGDEVQEDDRVPGTCGLQAIVVQPHCQHNSVYTCKRHLLFTSKQIISASYVPIIDEVLKCICTSCRIYNYDRYAVLMRVREISIVYGR